jgi:hypothetical protein
MKKEPIEKSIYRHVDREKERLEGDEVECRDSIAPPCLLLSVIVNLEG